jgi:hypothetical protein
LEWSGQSEFVKQELRSWKVDGEKVGSVRSSGPFTFVTVDGAGHMVGSVSPSVRLMFDVLLRFHMISLFRRWRWRGNGWISSNSRARDGRYLCLFVFKVNVLIYNFLINSSD